MDFIHFLKIFFSFWSTAGNIYNPLNVLESKKQAAHFYLVNKIDRLSFEFRLKIQLQVQVENGYKSFCESTFHSCPPSHRTKECFAVQNLGLTSWSWADLMSYVKNDIQSEHLLALQKAFIIY